jgi:tetratricopeptide (TPR) repeat protein
MKKSHLFIIASVVSTLGISSCSEFLEQKPSKSIVVPQSLDDLQSILNSIDLVNSGDSFGLLLSDDLYITDDGWRGLGENIQMGYIWNKQLSNAEGNMPSWTVAYNNIFKFNVVLEEAKSIEADLTQEQEQLNHIRGTALFLRSYHYFELMQLFTYPIISAADLEREGIPMPLAPDFSSPMGRTRIGDIYNQIIADLQLAADLLPVSSSNPLRPSKVAAMGMLARVYLQLGEYAEALHESEKALSMKATLLDFNIIPDLENIPIPLYSYPIPRFNEEVVIQMLAGSQSYMFSEMTFVNQDVYDSYDSTDIRKYLFFNEPDQEGRVNFLGSFSGDYLLFSGISIGELYLIKSECLARLGRDNDAVETLNALLVKRHFSGSFNPYVTDGRPALDLVLKERRKELVYRGIIRWSDMRRFLRESEWPGVRSRKVEGTEYHLGKDPSDYVLEIPLNEQLRNDAL